jgi:hypothetical protein
MFRSIAVCLLLAGVAAGCASVNPSYANEYCLKGGTGGCSELEGDGSCQPCPDATWRQAHAAGPSALR